MFHGAISLEVLRVEVESKGRGHHPKGISMHVAGTPWDGNVDRTDGALTEFQGDSLVWDCLDKGRIMQQMFPSLGWVHCGVMATKQSCGCNVLMKKLMHCEPIRDGVSVWGFCYEFSVSLCLHLGHV